LYRERGKSGAGAISARYILQDAACAPQSASARYDPSMAQPIIITLEMPLPDALAAYAKAGSGMAIGREFEIKGGL
jgi:hypothetical protein